MCQRRVKAVEACTHVDYLSIYSCARLRPRAAWYGRIMSGIILKQSENTFPARGIVPSRRRVSVSKDSSASTMIQVELSPCLYFIIPLSSLQTWQEWNLKDVLIWTCWWTPWMHLHRARWVEVILCRNKGAKWTEGLSYRSIHILYIYSFICIYILNTYVTTQNK